MIGTIRVRVGRSSMFIKGQDAAAVETELRKVYAPMLDEGRKRADAVHAAMLRTWPILTGASRTSFEPVIILDYARYRAQVGYRSELPAVRYIQSSKHGRKRDQTRSRYPLQTDMQQPMKDQQQAFAADAAKILVDHLRRMFNG